MTGMTTTDSHVEENISLQMQLYRAREAIKNYIGEDLPTLNIDVGNHIAELIADLYHLAEHHKIGPDPIGYVLHFAETFYRADLMPRDDE